MLDLPYHIRDDLFNQVLGKYLNEGEKTLENVFARQLNITSRPENNNGNNERILSKEELTYAFNNGLMPQGSILYGFNNPYNVSLSNCFFMRTQDSIEGILDTCKKMAVTYKYRGGCGVDLTPLRPRGEKVKNAARTSTGAASFMELFSQVTLTIGQEGRRGALMLTMNIDHPDIFEFIKAKNNNNDDVKGANISVKITDEFMEAVANDRLFNLKWGPFEYYINSDGTKSYRQNNIKIYRTIRARELFDELIKCAWNRAEPGVIFWDRVKEWGPASYYITPEGTNPCSEIPMPDDDACTISSIYLPKFVINEYSPDSQFDFPRFAKVVRIGIRYLDLIKSCDNQPFESQKIVANTYRRIGLGMHGLGDTLLRLGIKYGSDESISFCKMLGRYLKNYSYYETAMLAKELGSFPAYNREIDERCSWLYKDLEDETIDAIKKYGRRNIQVNTMAPTGSISILTNNSSSSGEPIFRFSYVRTTRVEGKDTDFIVYHPEVLRYCKITGNKPENLPNYFVDSTHIRPIDRVRLQASLTRYIDHSISSTVNLPKYATLKDVETVFFDSWRLGNKGITVYRDGCREGILNTIDNEKINIGEVRETPEVLTSLRHKVQSGGENWYINVQYLNNRPFDIMAYSNNANDSAVEDANIILLYIARKYNLVPAYKDQVSKSKNQLELFTRLISLFLRASIPIDEIFADMTCIIGSIPFHIKRVLKNKEVFDPNCKNGNCG